MHAAPDPGPFHASAPEPSRGDPAGSAPQDTAGQDTAAQDTAPQSADRVAAHAELLAVLAPESPSAPAGRHRRPEATGHAALLADLEADVEVMRALLGDLGGRQELGGRHRDAG